eukprot:gene38995-62603_t
MRDAKGNFENLMLQAGPEGTLLVGFKNPTLKPLTGKTLAQVARDRGVSPQDAAIDLVIEDGSRVQVIYFLMDEANVARQTALPWMSFGSDAEGRAPEGPFLLSSTHPRAYGNFARLLARYVRDEKRLTLAEAIRKLTSLPAHNLGLREYIEKNHPHALAQMMERMLEMARQGYWQADASTVEELKD